MGAGCPRAVWRSLWTCQRAQVSAELAGGGPAGPRLGTRRPLAAKHAPVRGKPIREKSAGDCLRNASNWPPQAASLPQRICGGFGPGLPLTARRVLFRSPARSGGQVAGCRGPREPARSAATAARPWGCLVITRPRLGDHVHAVGVVGVGCGGAASAARHGRPAPGTLPGASWPGRLPPTSPQRVRGRWRGGSAR